METLLRPIALNEKSYNVNVLHKALAALGLPVSETEVAQNEAGQDTLKKVRTLQVQLNVPVDESTLVNEVTSLAIAEALTKRGLTAASRSFTVTGKVRIQNDTVKKRQRLLAFDLDLRGVRVYRTIQSIAEIQKYGGFEFLAEAVSDNLGNYRITFSDWQYREAERKKADVVVYAIEGEEIIGLSRMVNSEDYSDKGLVRDLDVIITQEDKGTEYESLMNALNAFLKQSKTSLHEIATSADQLVFTAGELDLEMSHIKIAASAELLAKKEQKPLSHELLYGIARQDIRLTWVALYKRNTESLRKAIEKSVNQRIIRKFQKREITVFLRNIRECAVKHMLDDKDTDNKNTLNVMLKNALPEEKLRLSFVKALGDFKGRNFREFWDKHLPEQPKFKDNPELISGLLLTQQLTLLTGNHQALVNELQVNKNIPSIHQLIDIEKKDWKDIIEKSGVPDFIEGKDDVEKIDRYYSLMQSLLNAAFPTQRIAKMVGKNELPIEKTRISKSISAFLSENEQFDFAGSRIHDFKEEIKAVAGKDFDEVRSELMKIQRVFQVSTRPEAMSALLENNLHSAYTIANIPRKSFIKTYGKALGDEQEAYAVHQRASHISTRAEMAAMHLMEYSHGLLPKCTMDDIEYKKTMKIIQDHLPNPTPNYAELFGSPDICECEHCLSVYSPAAYFVDLLRFLNSTPTNPNMPIKYTDSATGATKNLTPLDVLVGNKDAEIDGRRPDLAALPLTCENTNTLIPYIDLVNEVMEYYTATGSLGDYIGYDTGETTSEELRANPQNFNERAYEILGNTVSDKPVVYPFTLPYHEPIDVIRTYSEHLRVSRYEAMKAMNPDPEIDTIAERAIGAESINLSQEEYTILTGEVFDVTASTEVMPLHKYFGYANRDAFANMQNKVDAEGNPRGIRPLLERTGLAYTELVELVKTLFINPHQEVFAYIGKILSYATTDVNTIYTRLAEIAGGRVFDPATDSVILDALEAFNEHNDPDITAENFAQRLVDHSEDIKQVITLFEPQSRCVLETTKLRTIHNIYNKEDPTSEIPETTWSKIHRFIRLWRKLGWTIHEVDIMLAALGEDDITSETIRKLKSVSLLKEETKLPINKLAVIWGVIDTYGDRSLYKKLFLNKAVQQIDEAFKPNAWGYYLQDNTETLADHQSAILAAFRITQEDLDTILEVVRVIDGGNPRPIDIDTDILNLHNLSTLYRYVVLAKALKMKVPDLCGLINLFGASPFSTLDIQQEELTNISPEDTYEFYKLAASTKSAGFKSSVLEYILQGTVPADSTIGLDKEKIFQTAKAIHDAFAIIEQDHPETPAVQLTSEIITAKLSLTFQPEIVSRFMGIVAGTPSFETITDDNLDVTIPDDLNQKYIYIKGSGRLTCAGIMTDTEQSTLKGLTNASINFKAAVDKLYAAPETFINENFIGDTSEKLVNPAEELELSDFFPDDLKNKISYDAPRTRLIFKGIMFQEEKNTLLELTADEEYQAGIEALFQKSQKSHGIFSDPVNAKKMLLDHPAEIPDDEFENRLPEKLAYVYEQFLPVLKNRLRQDAINQHIASLIGLSEEATALLIAEDIDALITDLSTEGFSATYFNDINWNNAALERADSTINFSWGTDAPDDDVSADNFSVKWKAYIAAPASGKYTLLVEVEEADEAFNLYLDDALILAKSTTDDATSLEVVTDLNAAQMHFLTLQYAEVSQNAGVRLRWKTATRGLEIIPASVAYPAAIIDVFAEKATFFHRAAKFILGFEISETELDHFIQFKSDYGDIDLIALTAEHWKRIKDYMALRNNVPQAQALLTDIFALANTPDTAPTVDQLTEMLNLATGWDRANLDYLVKTHFNFSADEFKNEIGPNQLHEVMQIVSKTGVSAETIAEWGAVETEFDALHNTAQLMKNTVKSKYEEEDWLNLAGNLSDKIRENQKQALISFLLMQPDIQKAGVEDADGLFEYFLIDVQMGTCMDTSRIVQANAAIQMFVNRCLLNLEIGVSPEAIDKDHWEWMKNYRVWEANRKVFLYPENWLEPEWRNDRSEFFKELESYLVQNDITERSVEQAFRNYLTGLNDVANLEVCGMCQEDDDDGNLKYLHVFARTHNAPYKFFYRRWNKYRK